MPLPEGISWIRTARLAIGGYPHSPEHWSSLQGSGIASVLSCCDPSEGPWLPPSELAAAQLALPDHRQQTPLSPALLDQAIGLALPLLAQHPALYLHCWAGLERAPLLAVALLCRAEGLDLFTALAQVRQACPSARPLRQQLVVLEQWLEGRHGGTSL